MMTADMRVATEVVGTATEHATALLKSMLWVITSAVVRLGAWLPLGVHHDEVYHDRLLPSIQQHCYRACSGNETYMAFLRQAVATVWM